MNFNDKEWFNVLFVGCNLETLHSNGERDVRVHIINILIILNAKAIIHCTGENLKITTETHINTSILQIC